jgi:hypothetical protein
MKKLIFACLMLGFALTRETEASSYCTSSNAQGKLRYVFSPSAYTDGRIIIKLEDANHADVCTSWTFSLIPSVVGSQRFDLMYSNLLAAFTNNLIVYIEFDPANQNLLGVGPYNSYYTP